MGTGDKELFAIVEKNVLSWLYLADKQEDADALYRLARSDNARVAWVALSKKRLHQSGGFSQVASFIGRHAVSAFLDPSEKRTSREIRDASSEAVNLARKLKFLIESNSTLRNYGENLIPPVERAAFSRLQRGLIHMATEERKHPDRWFSPEIEKELDELQARDYPEYSGMTTSEAYRIVKWVTISDDFFLAMLDEFIKQAIDSSSYSPIVSRPNTSSADQHVFAIQACNSLQYFYGSPNIEIVAGFASAIFDCEVSADTIKKWWVRRDKT